MYKRIVAALLVVLSICVLSACAGTEKGNPAEAGMSASGTPVPEDASVGIQGDVPDTAVPGVPPADGDILWQGDPVLDFTAETAGGGEFVLSEQAGKVVLVNFWATWCGPCVRELPDIAELYREYADGDDVEIILVNCGESADAVDAFLERNGYGMPAAYDPDGDIAGAYGVDAIPRTVIFGRDGTVAADYTGMRDYDTFKSAVAVALEG